MAAPKGGYGVDAKPMSPNNNYGGAQYNAYGAQPPPTAAATYDNGASLQGIPLYPDCQQPEAQRFVVNGYRDVWAAILFILMVFVSLGFAVFNIKDVSKNSDELSDDGKSTLKAFRIWLPAGLGVSLLVAGFCLALMKAFTRQFIIIANIMVIVLNLALAIFAFTQQVYILGVLWLLCAVLQGVWLYLVRRRIPFATVLLKTSVTLVMRYHGTFVVSFLGLVACVLYFAVWCVMGVPVVNKLSSDEQNSEGWVFAAALGLLLALLWATQVFTNVVHVTSSGVVATWYFLGEESIPAQPTVASVKRATSTSFGSICFGSLVVAIVKLMYYLVRAAAQNSQNDVAACIAVCASWALSSACWSTSMCTPSRMSPSTARAISTQQSRRGPWSRSAAGRRTSTTASCGRCSG
jgi:hypothetical protein